MSNNIQNKVNNRVIIPLHFFMRQEKSGGLILAISVIIALILANSPHPAIISISSNRRSDSLSIITYTLIIVYTIG